MQMTELQSLLRQDTAPLLSVSVVDTFVIRSCSDDEDGPFMTDMVAKICKHLSTAEQRPWWWSQ